jgi:putative FmdB family regulatory protein
MPIYEFACNECHQSFEELVSMSKIDEVVCPSCGSENVKKKMSTFASKFAEGGDSFSLNTSSAPSCAQEALEGHSCLTVGQFVKGTVTLPHSASEVLRKRGCPFLILMDSKPDALLHR